MEVFQRKCANTIHIKYSWPFIDVFLYYEDWVPARPSPGGKKLYHLSPREVTETATEGKAEKGFKGHGPKISVEGIFYSKFGCFCCLYYPLLLPQFPRDSVFPLSTVQFMGLDLAAPRDIRKHLVSNDPLSPASLELLPTSCSIEK